MESPTGKERQMRKKKKDSFFFEKKKKQKQKKKRKFDQSNCRNFVTQQKFR